MQTTEFEKVLSITGNKSANIRNEEKFTMTSITSAVLK